jgi:hypothetical protein
MYSVDCVVFIMMICSIIIEIVKATPGSSGNNDHEVDNGDFYCVEGSTDC